MAVDVERARAETPGCSERIHLNHAGASLMSRAVIDAQVGYLELEGRVGGYEAARLREEEIASVYTAVGTLIGAPADRVALVENATVAWQQAFGSLPLQPGDVVVTTEVAYGANYVTALKAVRDRGVEVRVAPSDSSGQVDVDGLAGMIDDRTKVVSVVHVPTNGGLVNSVREIGEVVRSSGAWYLLDGAQSIGQLKVDVGEIGCDFLVGTGRKFVRGPRGTGFLYASDRALAETEPPAIDHFGAPWTSPDRYELRPDARRYENWEFNYASVLGLGKAAEEAVATGIAEIEERIAILADGLRIRLAAAGLEPLDLGEHRCALVTTLVPGRDSYEVRDRLFERGINVSVTTKGSTLLDFRRRSLRDMLRLSVHYFNTEAELDAAVEVLADLV